MNLIQFKLSTSKDIVFDYNKEEETLYYEGEEIVSVSDLYFYIQDTRLGLIELDIEKKYDEDNFHYQLFVEVEKNDVKISTAFYECTSDYLTDHRGCWGSVCVDPNYQSDADYYNKEQARECMELLLDSLSETMVIDYESNKIHDVKVETIQ